MEYATPTLAPQVTDNRIVDWSIRAVKDEAKSLEAGRPIYADREFIRIRLRDDPTVEFCHPVSDEEKDEFAGSYDRWRRKHSMDGVEGTILEQWSQMPRSVVMELREGFALKTVEQIAALTDAKVKDVPSGEEWRAAAQAWLKASKDSAPMAALAEENRQLKAQLAALRAQYDEAMKHLDAATAPKGKGKG